MPELLVAWVAFPAIQILIWLGCGSLGARSCAGEIPRALLAPLGFCVVVVVGGFTTAVPGLAWLTTPVVVVLALAGFLLAPPWRGGRPSPWLAGGARRRLRRLCGADRPLGERHLRRLHPPRRHRDLARPDRPGDGGGPRHRRPRAVVVRGDALLQPRRRLSGRRLHPAGRGPGADGDGRRLAHPALHGAPRGPARARALGPRRPPDRERAGAGARGLRRGPAGAPLRLLPVGRDQGAGRRGADRAGRLPRLPRRGRGTARAGPGSRGPVPARRWRSPR